MVDLVGTDRIWVVFVEQVKKKSQARGDKQRRHRARFGKNISECISQLSLIFTPFSVKWVGLFTIATIGVCVLKYLQEARTHLYISTVSTSREVRRLV